MEKLLSSAAIWYSYLWKMGEYMYMCNMYRGRKITLRLLTTRRRIECHLSSFYVCHQWLGWQAVENHLTSNEMHCLIHLGKREQCQALTQTSGTEVWSYGAWIIRLRHLETLCFHFYRTNGHQKKCIRLTFYRPILFSTKVRMVCNCFYRSRNTMWLFKNVETPCLIANNKKGNIFVVFENSICINV